MVIDKDNKNLIYKGANFTKDEVHAASFGYYGKSFIQQDQVLKALQAIREYYNTPIKINASSRTIEHEIKQGRSGNSQHTLGNAIDFSFANNPDLMDDYHNQILNKGILYTTLRRLGINGFGLYDNFGHIDTRTTGGAQSDNHGEYAFWDRRITRKKKSQRQ